MSDVNETDVVVGIAVVVAVVGEMRRRAGGVSAKRLKLSGAGHVGGDEVGITGGRGAGGDGDGDGVVETAVAVVVGVASVAVAAASVVTTHG
jgi:hypothetical protein